MLLSFQRPSPPGRRGFLLEDAPRPFPALGAEEYSHISLGGTNSPNLGNGGPSLTACRKVAHSRTKRVAGVTRSRLGNQNPCKSALSELQHAARNDFNRDVERITGQRSPSTFTPP